VVFGLEIYNLVVPDHSSFCCLEFDSLSNSVLEAENEVFGEQAEVAIEVEFLGNAVTAEDCHL